MNRIPLTVVLAMAFVALVTVRPLNAGVPLLISNQGRLTDDSGVALNGSFQLTFRIYENPVGGTAHWTEVHDDVSVVGGLYGVLLGAVTPLAPEIFDSPNTFLGVTINGGAELLPRRQIVATAYALRAGSVDGAGGGEILGNLSVQGELAASDSLHAVSVRIGSSARDGGLSLFRGGSSQPVALLEATASGSRLVLRDLSAAPAAQLAADLSSGGGGMLVVNRDNQGHSGVVIDGNYAGTASPSVAITGAERSALFDMTVGGDNSVMLPAGSISALEIANEPGVASNVVTAAALSNSLSVLTDRSLNCPGNGYVIVIASAQLEVNHLQGAADEIHLAVSDQAVTIPASQDYRWLVPSVLPSATIAQPVTVQAVFVVNAGARNFYLLGRQDSGAGATAANINLTALFVPTWYGIAPAASNSAAGELDAQIAARAAAEQAAERESLEARLRRLEAELLQQAAAR